MPYIGHNVEINVAKKWAVLRLPSSSDVIQNPKILLVHTDTNCRKIYKYFRNIFWVAINYIVKWCHWLLGFLSFRNCEVQILGIVRECSWTAHCLWIFCWLRHLFIYTLVRTLCLFLFIRKKHTTNPGKGGHCASIPMNSIKSWLWGHNY